MRISIVMPVLDEAATVATALEALQDARRARHEVIVVDGGSRDATVTLAAPLADHVLAAARGRASQMNAGAAAATGDALVFLHADTQLPPGALDAIARALGDPRHTWGRFDVEITGRHRLLPLVAGLMNLRSRITGIATGDQAIFVRAAAFRALGGFPAIALMEDVSFSAAAKRLARPACLRERVRTSGRRWERDGVLRTVLLMWWLRLRFFLGASPDALVRSYYGGR